MIMLCVTSFCVAQEQSNRQYLKSTHWELTLAALQLVNLPLFEGWETIIAQGSIDEDRGDRPVTHAYNPITGTGWTLGGIPSINEAERLWNRALDARARGDIREAMYLLGRALHHIMDMGVPAHVYLDLHPLFGDDYEAWAAEHFDEYDFSGLSPLFAPERDNIRSVIHTMAMFTYTASAFPGKLSRSNPQPDSELNDMFAPQFIPGIFGGHWEIDNVGTYGTLLGILGENSWWPALEDEGNFYIENSGGFDGNLTPATYNGVPNNRTLLRIYGDTLLPKVVQYVAGMLIVFSEFEPPKPHFVLNLSPGLNLVHLPIKVDTVDGMPFEIDTVGDLYEALSGEDNVHLIITSTDGTPRAFFGPLAIGTPADPEITSNLGMVVIIKNAVQLELEGTPLPDVPLTLFPGINIVGISDIPDEVSALFQLTTQVFGFIDGSFLSILQPDFLKIDLNVVIVVIVVMQ